MPSAQSPQDLPSFSLALRPDHYTSLLPNLSYPSRPNAHIPWSGSTAPLLLSKNTAPDMTVATSINILVPPAVNTFSVSGAFHRINMFIWHNLSMIVQKLKLIKEKLFRVRATSLSVTTSV